MRVDLEGLDGLCLSMSEIAEIPDDVQDAMLNAQADVAIPAQQAKARSYGVVDTGLVVSSIKKSKVKIGKNGRCIFVYPQGSRIRGSGKKKPKKRIRNAEIAFLAEYGQRKQKARPFIRDANESCAEQTTQAAAKIYDSWLKSKNL